MTQILYPPDWLNESHWLVLSTLFCWLAAYSWLMFHRHKDVLSLTYGVAWTSAFVISGCFYLIQSVLTPIPPLYLFIVERAFWWPLVLSAVVLVDIHAADFSGHRSMVARWGRRLSRRKAHHAQQ